MKNRISYLALTFLLTIGGYARAEKTLDVAAVNKVIGKILTEIIQEEAKKQSPVTGLELKFDEKETDLSKGDRIRVKLSSKVSLSKSGWNSPAKLSVDIAAGADSTKREADVTGSAKLETNSLALIRHIAKGMEKDSSKPLKDPYDADGAFQKITVTQFQKLQKAANLKATWQVLAELNTNLQNYAKNKASLLEKELAKETDSVKKVFLEKAIASNKEDLSLVDSFGSQFKKSLEAPGDQKEYSVKLSDLKLTGIGTLAEFEVRLSETQVSFLVKYSTTDEKYIEMVLKEKPVVEQYLIKLQSGDEEAQNGVKFLASALLDWAKGLVL